MANGTDQLRRWLEIGRGFVCPIALVGIACIASLIESFLVVLAHSDVIDPSTGPSHCDFYKAFFVPYVIAIGIAAIIAPRRYRLAAFALATTLSLILTLNEFYSAANPPIVPQAVPAAALHSIQEACIAARAS